MPLTMLNQVRNASNSVPGWIDEAGFGALPQLAVMQRAGVSTGHAT